MGTEPTLTRTNAVGTAALVALAISVVDAL